MAAARHLVLTLDVGTSSVRAMLHDGALEPVGEVQIQYRPRIAGDGTAEMDADQLVEHCRTAIGRVLHRLRRSDRVAAVGFSSFWHGLLGLDAGDRPSTPLLLWSDTRSWRQARALGEQLDGEAVRRRTGAPIHPSFWPAKLSWLRGERREDWDRTRRWVSFADYLYLQRFGEIGTSASMASGTGLRRLDGGGWDEELLDRLGVDAGMLPPAAEEMRGCRGPEGWPRLAEADWLTARGDGALANLGSDCTDPSRRALTVGTSGALRAVTTTLPSLAPGLWCYLVDPGRYLVGGSFSNGGNLHEWLLQNLRVDAGQLERGLRKLPPASAEVTFLPLLYGERSPHFAPRAFGALAPITGATSAIDIARSASEAAAMLLAVTNRALDASAPGEGRLMASGGALVHSPAWCQVMADAIGRPLSILPVSEASSRGAALEAWRRAGAEAPPPLRVKRTFRPRMEAHRAYGEAYLRLETLYGALIRDRLFEGARGPAPEPGADGDETHPTAVSPDPGQSGR
ncbi:MAG TPA: FGGY family carbohydrate kinase [Candidatus Dormibacteraeota bacterium]|nr:FGGY family carbohydrate kinase [Candidatus Dormibacteraeota bacterium]